MRVRLRLLSCRSLRDLFLTIVVVAMVSVALTYHLSRNLPARPPAEFKIHFNGRVDIYRTLGQGQGKGQGQEMRDRRDLEGIDLDVKSQQVKGRGELPHDVIDQITKIEAELDELSRGGQKVALVRGQPEVVGRDLTLYEHALSRVGYRVDRKTQLPTREDERGVEQLEKAYNGSILYQSAVEAPGVRGATPAVRDVQQIRGVSESDPPWNLYLCLTERDARGDLGVCNSGGSLAPTRKGQKVNRLLDYPPDMWSKSSLCTTLSNSMYIPAVRNSKLFPPCYLLPSQAEEFLAAAEAKPNTAWVFKPLKTRSKVTATRVIGPEDKVKGTEPKIQLLQPTQDRDFLKIKSLLKEAYLVQASIPHQLQLYGLPFSVRVYVLVTSLSPLRAYLHSEGVVYHRYDYQKNYEKIPGRVWSLEKWRHHLVTNHHQGAARQVWINTESVLLHTLLLMEAGHRPDPDIKKCSGCYQLLSVELVYNSSFHPTVIEVSPSPDIQDVVKPDNSGRWGSIHSNVIDDTISMVTAQSPVAADVLKALAELNREIVIKESGVCNIEHRTCLHSRDIEHLLAWRRETSHRGAFTPLYPSHDSDRFTQLMSELGLYTQRRHGNRHGNHDNSTFHTTSELHSTMTSVAKFFHQVESMDHNYDDLNMPLFPDGKSSTGVSKAGNNEMNNSSLDKMTRPPCVEDKHVMPYLHGFITDPPLNFTPTFNLSTSEYYASVPYDLYLVRVWAWTLSCYSEARMEEKYGLSRPSNYTLGLGSNGITIVIVDVTHTEPWIINSYTLTIYRQYPGEGLPPFSLHTQTVYKVCKVVQDCDLSFIPGEKCGLQPTRYYSWVQYKSSMDSLPLCTTGHAPGEWLVPCTSCSDSSSCHWKLSAWQPHRCRHNEMSREKVKKCLAGKQVMFIGDSTNRGMMHYLMEAANDSLTEWDKTHNIKVYSNINNQQTSVSFAYYPQFWLPANQRPVFDKALYQLMKQSMPLENNHNTVLVVGGVHWIATHHLNVIKRALEREGLSNIRVIIKSLGAGFHQPVDGLHCLTLREQRKLLVHNQGLVDYADSLGYGVVDTFNMTMAKYKDFLQGKCACHFHRVKEVLPSFTQFMRSTGHNGQSELLDMPIHYHVEGDINAVYSEILINNICAET